jgi:hypothetical protein
MTLRITTLAAVAAGTVLATNAFAQSAKEVLGATPYVGIESEPPPNLTVDPPIPDQLARGVVEIHYRVENLHSFRCSERLPSTCLHGSGIRM